MPTTNIASIRSDLHLKGSHFILNYGHFPLGESSEMGRDMKGKHLKINIPRTGQSALTLSGRLENYSTRQMHTHAYHQVLTIGNGVSLLEDYT
jgi:hypothetical protein